MTYVGNRESISDVMAKLIEKELGGTGQEQVDAFNAAIRTVDRASFGNGNEADYKYMQAVFRAGRASLSASKVES